MIGYIFQQEADKSYFRLAHDNGPDIYTYDMDEALIYEKPLRPPAEGKFIRIEYTVRPTDIQEVVVEVMPFLELDAWDVWIDDEYYRTVNSRDDLDKYLSGLRECYGSIDVKYI